MRVDRKVVRGNPRLCPVPESAGEYFYAFPVTSAQQRPWILNQVEPNPTSYTAPWSIRMTGKLGARVLQRTLNEIHETNANYHEVLRYPHVQFVSKTPLGSLHSDAHPKEPGINATATTAPAAATSY
jgi:hypothetical protein